MPLAVTIFSYREVFKKIREHKVPRSGTISLHTSEGFTWKLTQKFEFADLSNISLYFINSTRLNVCKYPLRDAAGDFHVRLRVFFLSRHYSMWSLVRE